MAHIVHGWGKVVRRRLGSSAAMSASEGEPAAPAVRRRTNTMTSALSPLLISDARRRPRTRYAVLYCQAPPDATVDATVDASVVFSYDRESSITVTGRSNCYKNRTFDGGLRFWCIGRLAQNF